MIKINNCAIFGGTFDPFHLGHLHLVDWLIDSARFDEVVIVPAGSPWQRETLASPTDRLAMVKLALSDRKVTVSDCEIKRSGPTYAIDTVKELANSFSAESISWVIGSDAFASIESWHEIEALAKKVSFLVVTRPGGAVIQAPTYIRWEIVEIAALAISATEIRAQLAAGDDCSEQLPSAVATYIRDNGLYGASR